MSVRLCDVTMREYVAALCGDASWLAGRGVGRKDIAATVRRLVREFQEIADPAGFRSALAAAEEKDKAALAAAALAMCKLLARLGHGGRARDVLSAYGVDATGMDGARLLAEIDGRLRRLSAERRRREDNGKAGGEERADVDWHREFDAMTAAMMAYFRFQIDASCMAASVYAHLVAQYRREVKARIAAAKK